MAGNSNRSNRQGSMSGDDVRKKRSDMPERGEADRSQRSGRTNSDKGGRSDRSGRSDVGRKAV